MAFSTLSPIACLPLILEVFFNQALANEYDEKFENFFSQFENSEMLSPALGIAIENHGQKGGVALDIGAGTGRDTVHLLKAGFEVIALDPAEQAVSSLNRRFKKQFPKRFRSVESTIEKFELPSNLALVNIAWTSRFLNPKEFADTFGRITNSLKVGGRFTGDFCGERWKLKNKKRKGMFLSYQYVMTLFSANYKIEYFKEKLKVHNDGFTEHLYEVVALKIK